MVNNSTYTLIGLVHTDIYPILLPVIVLGFGIGVLNLYTISIIIRSKSLCRAANFPIVSILLGATMQGALTAPTYIFKRLDENVWHTNNRPWLCDFYRLPYFLCGHSLKVSLMVVSFDRLIAIKFPLRYGSIVTKKLSLIVTAAGWLIVLIIDIIPFYPFGNKSDDEGCRYIPKQEWGITVITLFNIIPFTAVTINYLIIWRAAAKVTFTQYDQHQSVWIGSSTVNSSSEDFQNQYDAYNTHSIRKCNEQERLPRPDILDISKARKYSKSPTICDITNTRQNNDKNRRKSSMPRKKMSVESLINLKDKVLASSMLNGKTAVMIRLALEMKATKTSFTLLIVYLLCWGPLGIFYLLDHYCSSCISRVHDHSSTRFIIKVVSFSSSIFLPLMYCWKTKEFRSEICRFTCKKRYRKQQLLTFYKQNENTIPQIIKS